jgi:hypothetical protein
MTAMFRGGRRRVNLRKSLPTLAFLAGLLLCGSVKAQNSQQGFPMLGPAPRAPRDVSALPGKGLKKDAITPGFTVNGSSREEVREFFNAIYPASEGVPIDSTTDITNCMAGTASAAFQNAVLWRINWFRALSGISANETFDSDENAEDQSAALMMSANDQLLHSGIPTSWSCYTVGGASAAQKSNLALGLDGPDAITGYMVDYGSNNAALGHRRWLLYPQTQVMATGDLPAEGNYGAANATWVFDSNNGGPRPETTYPYVAWPPPGYVPYPVVFPQWSFALSNADLSNASVDMLSNGIPVNVTLQPYILDFGENTLVWYPSSLDPNNYTTVFPFSGVDTVYTVTVTNVRTVVGPLSFTYNVTIFDPSLPGPDYVPTLIGGTNHPSVNENNPYSCNPSSNPNTTGYQWLAAQSTNGDLADKALNGLINFSISPPPEYSIITNPPVGAGKCFHLCHTNPVPQLLQLTEVLYPATNTLLTFQSLLGYATSNEVARVQISTNASAWVDIYTQAGTGGAGQSAFAAHSLSLSNCAGQITLLRFNYDLALGSYYPTAAANEGWCLENIVVTNAIQLNNFVTNSTITTNFDFVPTTAGNWILEARGVIFSQFGLGWSAARGIVAVTNQAPRLIVLDSPTIADSQAQIPFGIMQGAASSFALLQSSQLNGPWTPVSGAALSTVTPGSSYQFTAPYSGVDVFYRVLAH